MNFLSSPQLINFRIILMIILYHYWPDLKCESGHQLTQIVKMIPKFSCGKFYNKPLPGKVQGSVDICVKWRDVRRLGHHGSYTRRGMPSSNSFTRESTKISSIPHKTIFHHSGFSHLNLSLFHHWNLHQGYGAPPALVITNLPVHYSPTHPLTIPPSGAS